MWDRNLHINLTQTKKQRISIDLRTTSHTNITNRFSRDHMFRFNDGLDVYRIFKLYKAETSWASCS